MNRNLLSEIYYLMTDGVDEKTPDDIKSKAKIIQEKLANAGSEMPMEVEFINLYSQEIGRTDTTDARSILEDWQKLGYYATGLEKYIIHCGEAELVQKISALTASTDDDLAAIASASFQLIDIVALGDIPSTLHDRYRELALIDTYACEIERTYEPEKISEDDRRQILADWHRIQTCAKAVEKIFQSLQTRPKNATIN